VLAYSRGLFQKRIPRPRKAITRQFAGHNKVQFTHVQSVRLIPTVELLEQKKNAQNQVEKAIKKMSESEFENKLNYHGAPCKKFRHLD